MPMIDQSREKLIASRLEAIADQLDAREDKSRARSEGGKARLRYRSKGLTLMALHPGGGIARFPAATRHISVATASILTTCFLHDRTACSLVLRELSGAPVPMRGEVTACRHVQHSIHEVLLKLDEEIDVSAFVAECADSGVRGSGASDADSPQHAAGSTHAAAPKTLHGRVLLVEDDAAERRLYSLLLGKAHADVTGVATAQEALAALSAGPPFDLILTDLNLVSGSGEDVINGARGAGFKDPILVITGELSASRLSGLAILDVQDVVCKPATPQTMLKAIVDALEESKAGDKPPKIFSSIDDEPESAEYVNEFVRSAADAAAEIESARAAGDTPKLANLLLKFTDDAATHGFERLERTTRQVMVAVEASTDLSTVQPVIVRLQTLCSRLDVRSKAS